MVSNPVSKQNTANQNTGMSTIAGDYPMYVNFSQLLENSDIVVLGKVVNVNKNVNININSGSDKDTNPANYDFTVSDIEVKDVLIGNVKKGDIIQVKQFNNMEGVEYLKNDKKGIFFLESYSSVVPCDLINPDQGFVETENDKLKLNEFTKDLFKNASSIDDVNNLIKNNSKSKSN
jgi:hypothetical protein